MEGYKIEKWVIIILWTGMLVSFPIAFFGERGLYLSDIIGFISLAMVSLIFYFKKSAGLFALLILLFIGTTNVATFIAFWSYRISFNSVGQQLAPGIQLYSLIFFAALAVLRRPTILEGFRSVFGVSEKDQMTEFDGKILYFKKRFDSLGTEEIERKLKTDLSEEASIALQLILDERKAN